MHMMTTFCANMRSQHENFDFKMPRHESEVKYSLVRGGHVGLLDVGFCCDNSSNQFLAFSAARKDWS